MVPRIISQKCLVMVNPRPVPPNRRVVEPSAWLNAWNNLLICSAVIPMPVSVTRKTMLAAAGISPSPPAVPGERGEGTRRTSSRISPCLVNLLELPKRLNKHCRTLTRSLSIEPMSSGQSTTNALAFWTTNGRIVLVTSPIRVATSNDSSCSSIIWASIFERSRMSLISPSRC